MPAAELALDADQTEMAIQNENNESIAIFKFIRDRFLLAIKKRARVKIKSFFKKIYENKFVLS